jgi:MFS transporter, putative metabolite:H+ symporter
LGTSTKLKLDVAYATTCSGPQCIGPPAPICASKARKKQKHPSQRADEPGGKMSKTVSPIGQRLDRLPPGKLHVRLLFLVGAGMFFDGFDIYLAAGVLGALVREGISDVATNAWFISATFAGMTLGAWLAGILGDRFGRRFSYQFNLAIFGLASLASAFAPSIDWLIAFRFLMGLGLGAEIVIGYGTLTEFMPPQVRGRYGALLNVFTNSALFVATFGGFLIIPYLGWRWMFGIAGIGATIIWALRKNMYESPRWLESKGRLVEANRLMGQIEAEAGVTSPAVSNIPADAPATAVLKVPLRSLFKGRLLPRTFTGMVINVINNLITHGFITWMPTFFIAEGLTVTKSLAFTAVMTLGAPVGSLTGYLLTERLGRKNGTVIFSLVALVIGLIYPHVSSPIAVMATGFCLVACIFILGALSIACYVPELFPTEIRLRGVGLCSTTGRLANVGIPFLIAFLYTRGGVTGVLALISAGLLVQAIVVWIFGAETRGLALEDVNAPPELPLSDIIAAAPIRS